MTLWQSLPVVVGLFALGCGQVTGGADEEGFPAARDDEERTELGDVESTEAPDQGAVQSNPVQPSQLCNGSADVRFLYVSAGGFNDVPFLYHSGNQYLAIDGQCRYWLGEANLVGLRGGELAPERAVAFARDLQYGQYASVPSYQTEACYDCSSIILVDDTGVLGRDSGESASPSPVWEAATRAAIDVAAELREEAAHVAPPSKTLLALRTERSDVLGVVPLDLETRAMDIDEIFSNRPEHWVVVDDTPTIDLLAQLQRSALLADSAARSVVVEDVQGRHYEVLVRDEPPAPVAAALDRALLRNLP